MSGNRFLMGVAVRHKRNSGAIKRTPRPIDSVPLPGSTIDGSTASLAPLTPVVAAPIPVSASAPAPAASAAKPQVALNAAAEPKRVTR